MILKKRRKRRKRSTNIRMKKSVIEIARSPKMIILQKIGVAMRMGESKSWLKLNQLQRLMILKKIMKRRQH